MLDNVRFYKEETKNDPEFAKKVRGIVRVPIPGLKKPGWLTCIQTCGRLLCNCLERSGYGKGQPLYAVAGFWV